MQWLFYLFPSIWVRPSRAENLTLSSPPGSPTSLDLTYAIPPALRYTGLSKNHPSRWTRIRIQPRSDLDIQNWFGSDQNTRIRICKIVSISTLLWKTGSGCYLLQQQKKRIRVCLKVGSRSASGKSKHLQFLIWYLYQYHFRYSSFFVNVIYI